MIDFLKFFKSVIKLEQVCTDNNVFKLHYKLTVILLLAFSVLLSGKQYFGEPINCDVEKNKDVYNTFCWALGTYIVKETLNDPFAPGLGVISIQHYPSAVTRQIYYQWVWLAFCIQAIIFYVPRYLWKTWESGRLKLLLKDLNGPVMAANWTAPTRENLVKYLLQGKHTHNIYTLRYCFCEILNFINVIAQIYFLDWFITGKFSVYGIAYATYTMYKNVNPLNEAFPKLTKCTYFKFGPSGTMENRDALCILPLNVLNEKFFLILWYWLFILLFVSFLALLYRALFLFVPKFRVYLLRAQTRSIDRTKCQCIINNITYGDFFILYKIGKNINPLMYKEFVACIYEYLTSKQSLYENSP